MKDSSPTFSIIMPTYNRADLVGEVVNNVLDQTFSDFELIVVDDGSTDNTWDVLRGISDARLKPIRQDNTRHTQARRNAIAHASGRILAFCDSDDVWRSDYLATLERIFTLHHADYVFTNYRVEGEGGSRIDPETPTVQNWLRVFAWPMEEDLYWFDDLYSALIEWQPVFTSCQAITRAHYDAIGGISEKINNRDLGTVMTSEDSHIIRRSALTPRAFFYSDSMVTLGRPGNNMSASFISNLKGGRFILQDILNSSLLTDAQKSRTVKAIKEHTAQIALQSYYFEPPGQFLKFYVKNRKSSMRMKSHLHVLLASCRCLSKSR